MGGAGEEPAKRHGSGTQLRARGKGRAFVQKLSSTSHYPTVSLSPYNSEKYWLFGQNSHLEMISKKGNSREKYLAIPDVEEYIFGHITKFYWFFYDFFMIWNRLENLSRKRYCWNPALMSSWKHPNIGQALWISYKSYPNIDHFITTFLGETSHILAHTSVGLNMAWG